MPVAADRPCTLRAANTGLRVCSATCMILTDTQTIVSSTSPDRLNRNQMRRLGHQGSQLKESFAHHEAWQCASKERDRACMNGPTEKGIHAPRQTRHRSPLKAKAYVALTSTRGQNLSGVTNTQYTNPCTQLGSTLSRCWLTYHSKSPPCSVHEAPALPYHTYRLYTR